MNKCTLAFDTADAQSAFEQSGAFLHVMQPTRKDNCIGHEADAIVLDLQMDQAVNQMQVHNDFACQSVALSI